MPVIGVTGDLRRNLTEQFEWKIPNFFSISKCYPNRYNSPTFKFAHSYFHMFISSQLGYGGKSLIYLCLLSNDNKAIGGTYTLNIPDGITNNARCNVSDLVKFIHKDEGYVLAANVWCVNYKDLHDDTLIAVCNFFYPLPLEDTSSMKLIELETLSENFKELLSNKETCDITLKLDDYEFQAHKSVLIARSPVFAAMLKHEMSEKLTNVISVVDCEPKSFQGFLEYLYTGRMENVSFDSAFHLYVTADKYNVEKLKTFCLKYMEQNVTVENVCDIAVLSDDYDEAGLFAAAQKFFNRNMDNIFKTDMWKSFMINNSRIAQKLLVNMAPKVKVVD